MIGVVIPAHNEEAFLATCLGAVCIAAAHPSLGGEEVCIIVALDSCTDRSHAIARTLCIETIVVAERNVGKARAAGADLLLARGARWLAFTDADSVVAHDWLITQLMLDVEAVCGCVSVHVDDWQMHPTRTREIWQRRYQPIDGHRHVHGANLGVAAHAYQRAGGFPPLACDEDVALVNMLIVTGARIAWSAAPRVTTSGRLDSRARGGFGDTLAAWSTE
ncbi:glycosyltransferase [Paraburkholderia phosphatilytica]|uniref:glycosyltransferase n=1 Tax=Paraburkholderia phosphatilytica TaxID=2282883 RepID=UPI000E4DE8CE|nr:glycosyltransferase [Paraburkholderia phosphatilytica]